MSLVGCRRYADATCYSYYDQDKGPRPENPDSSSTTIKNIRFENFSGFLTTNWTDGTCISSPCWNCA